MRKNQIDFSECRFDPNRKSFVKDITEGIPDFGKYDGENKNAVFSYIVMVFDDRSPLWDEEPEFFKRKVMAADIAGFPKNNFGNFKEESKEKIEGMDKDVNALVIAYLANIGNIEYMMLINEMVMFHQYTMETISNQANANTYKTLKDLSEGIRERTRKIFGSGDKDELERVRIELYESVEKDRQRLNPEAIVKLIEERGDLPYDWSPYTQKYKVDELKFYKKDD